VLTAPELETEAEKVEGWRLQNLLEAGYPLWPAVLLARATDVDLHLAVGLVKHGCSPQTAFEILI